jgi:imidazole glycerol-phosphate synthase subunit HisH
VHSYYAQTTRSGLTAGVSRYPAEFVCAAARGNLFAVQFHPEKSAAAGLRLLANFATWAPQ